MITIDGKKIAQKIKDKLKQEVIGMKMPPVLAAILVGKNPASLLYVKIKEKACQEVGIDFRKYLLPENVSKNDLLYLIDDLNKDETINGIIVQLPLPKSFDSEKIIATISSDKDVDALKDDSKVIPPTVAGILAIFEEYKINLKNKDVCLVGYGRLVGKPLTKELEKMGIKPDICNHSTENLAEHTKKADILISATGVAHLITAEMVKKDAIVIDAGTSIEKQLTTSNYQLSTKIMGDVDFEDVKNITSYITPSTGGVGPITVAKLLENVVILTRKNR